MAQVVVILPASFFWAGSVKDTLSGRITVPKFFAKESKTGFSQMHPSSILTLMNGSVSALPTDIEAWLMSSQAASLAKPSASPDTCSQTKTPAINGRLLLRSFAEYDPSMASLKTYPDCSLPGMAISEPYSGTWPLQGTMRNGRCSERVMLGHPTGVSGSGFLPIDGTTPTWSTPSTMDSVANRDLEGQMKRHSLGLSEQARLWPTPNSFDDSRSAGGAASRDKHQASLHHAVKWPTPNVTDATLGATHRSDTKGRHALALGHCANRGTDPDGNPMWATPKASPSGPDLARENRAGSGGDDLVTQVDKQQVWPTPRAGNPGSREPGTGGKVLAEEAKKLWPTPMALDGNMTNRPRLDGGQEQLTNAVQPAPAPASNDSFDWGEFFPVQEPVPGGNSTLPIVPETWDTCGELDPTMFPTPQASDWPEAGAEEAKNPMGQLNPYWVEWLMGWPIGWTDLRPSGMARCLSWLRQHGISCPDESTINPNGSDTMKAKIIKQLIYDGPMAYVHGSGQMILRLLIPEMNNLTIAVFKGKVVVWDKFDDPRVEVLGEVDVPDGLLLVASRLVEAQQRLDEQIDKINSLLDTKE